MAIMSSGNKLQLMNLKIMKKKLSTFVYVDSECDQTWIKKK